MYYLRDPRKGCSKPRTLKCLATPSLEEEEVLLGWGDMVAWGILKENFNILSDEDLPINHSSDVERSKTSVEKNSSAKSDATVCPPNHISAIGRVAADISVHPSDGTSGKGVYEDVDGDLEVLRNLLLSEFDDVFTDELGESDRMRGELVQLEIKPNAAAPYHCWTPATVSANHEKEARRMVQSMVEAGIIEEVSRSTNCCSRGFFV